MRSLRVINTMDARTAKAGLQYPILVYGSGKNRVILDGSHRIRRALATNSSLQEINVPDDILSKAVVEKEDPKKQYSPVNGKMVDIEKLWELTQGLKSVPVTEWPKWSKK